MKAIKSSIHPHIQAFLFIGIYLLLLAPFSLSYIFFMPDERHYVDAAIYMLRFGDYLSPHAPNGGFRFLKPIFTYWTILSSYFIFGISQFSSRLPFLLTAGMILWMTYQTTLLAFKEKKTALLALLITGATPILHRATAATLTDLYLLLFLQIMVWGVIGIIVSKDKKVRFLWAIYAGAGMAILTKGLPAIAFLAVSLSFLLANPWKKIKLKELVHWPSFLTGITAGSFWYIAVYLKHGSSALSSFMEDQVGIRVAAKLENIVTNFGLSGLVVLLILFPMMLPGWRSLFYINNKKELEKNKSLKTILAFTLLWVLAMIGMASMVSKFYYRYLMPVIPIIAMVFAHFILKNEKESAVKKMMNVSLVTSYLLLSLSALAALASAYLFKSPLWHIAVLFIGLVSCSYLFFKFRKGMTMQKSALTFGLMAAIFFTLYFLIKPISYPGQGLQITEKLKEHQIKGTESIQFYGKTRIASRIRVASSGDFFFKALKPFESDIQPETQVVIFEDTYLDSLALDKFYIEKASAVWKNIHLDEIVKVENKEELMKLKESRSENYYIGIRHN